MVAGFFDVQSKLSNIDLRSQLLKLLTEIEKRLKTYPGANMIRGVFAATATALVDPSSYFNAFSATKEGHDPLV